MIVKKTQLPTKSEYRHKPTVYYYTKKNKNNIKGFQKELFDIISNEEKENLYNLEEENLENEFKRMFLGEVVKKDHLLSASLTEIQKENIIKISEMYY